MSLSVLESPTATRTTTLRLNSRSVTDVLGDPVGIIVGSFFDLFSVLSLRFSRVAFPGVALGNEVVLVACHNLAPESYSLCLFRNGQPFQGRIYQIRLLFAEADTNKVKQPFCLLVKILYDDFFGLGVEFLSNGFLLLQPFGVLSLRGHKHLQLSLIYRYLLFGQWCGRLEVVLLDVLGNIL